MCPLPSKVAAKVPSPTVREVVVAHADGRPTGTALGPGPTVIDYPGGVASRVFEVEVRRQLESRAAVRATHGFLGIVEGLEVGDPIGGYLGPAVAVEVVAQRVELLQIGNLDQPVVVRVVVGVAVVPLHGDGDPLKPAQATGIGDSYRNRDGSRCERIDRQNGPRQGDRGDAFDARQQAVGQRLAVGIIERGGQVELTIIGIHAQRLILQRAGRGPMQPVGCDSGNRGWRQWDSRAGVAVDAGSLDVEGSLRQCLAQRLLIYLVSAAGRLHHQCRNGRGMGRGRRRAFEDPEARGRCGNAVGSGDVRLVEYYATG